MEVRPDLIIINASPSQKEILRNPKYKQFMKGIILDLQRWNRPRIPVSNISNVIRQLEKLKLSIADDPDYAKRRPAEVIDRIILNIRDAAKVQARTYARRSKAGAS